LKEADEASGPSWASAEGIATFASVEACIAALGIAALDIAALDIVVGAIAAGVRKDYAASSIAVDNSYMAEGGLEIVAKAHRSDSPGEDGHGEKRENGHVAGLVGRPACGSS
jgi:hypothetical protein